MEHNHNYQTNLRSHPVWSPNHGVTFLIARNISTKAKICYFNRSILAEKNIVWFNISMDYTLKNMKQYKS